MSHLSGFLVMPDALHFSLMVHNSCDEQQRFTIHAQADRLRGRSSPLVLAWHGLGHMLTACVLRIQLQPVNAGNHTPLKVSCGYHSRPHDIA